MRTRLQGAISGSTLFRVPPTPTSVSTKAYVSLVQCFWCRDRKSQNVHETVRTSRTREKGDNGDRWQHEDDLGSSIFVLPRLPADCQLSDPSARTQAWLLAPFIHHEVLKHYFVSCFVPAATRSFSAHKRPASMSWSVRRLQQEPFEKRSWKFPPGGSSPHWRLDSALF